MSDRSILIVTRVAVSGDHSRADLDPGPRERAQLAGPGDLPTEEYVAERFKIIERVAAPAIDRIQARADWVWLTCPERHDQVAENASRLKSSPWVLDQDEPYIPDLAFTDKWITVRLDSDDAIRPSAIDALEHMDLPPMSLVNWHSGYQLNWETGQVGMKEWKLRTQGPFLAVTNDSAGDMLNFGGPHTYARGGRHAIHVPGRNFVMTIHDHNQLSKFSPARVLDWEESGEALAEFGTGVPVNA